MRVNQRGRLLAAALAALVCLAATGPAAAETRTLKLYFVHTKERATITFKKNGRYVSSGLKDLNNFLRDWRQKEATKMDPRLFDLLWEVYESSGSNGYIHVVSAYRSPKTNAMLRSRSRGVAKNSQHIQGKAIDFYLPDVPVKTVRRIGMQFQVGGVGYYPKSGSPFVHLDVGSVRSWPRMSRQELTSVFPNGKTLHLPTDGKPLPGYNQALADYKSRVSANSIQVAGKRPSRSTSGAGSGGGNIVVAGKQPSRSTSGDSDSDSDSDSSSGGGGNLLAGLFGRNQDSDRPAFRGREMENEVRPARTETQVASAQATPEPPQAVPEPDSTPAIPELAFIPTPQSRPSPPDDVAQIAMAAATTGPLPVTPAVYTPQVAGAENGGVPLDIPGQDEPTLTVATLISSAAAATTGPTSRPTASETGGAAKTGGRVIPVPQLRTGSSDYAGTRIALARTRNNPPSEVVLGALLTAPAMAEPADTPLTREEWIRSESEAVASGETDAAEQLAYVPRPALRPDVQSADAQALTAAFETATGEPGAPGVPVPRPSPLGETLSPVQVALAPASGGVSEGIDMFATSTALPRAKSARPSADDAMVERRSPVRTEPRVTENMITGRTLTGVTLSSLGAAVTAPQFVSSHIRAAPNTVHINGFSRENTIASADQFTGQAVNFLTVARFDTSNR